MDLETGPVRLSIAARWQRVATAPRACVRARAADSGPGFREASRRRQNPRLLVRSPLRPSTKRERRIIEGRSGNLPIRPRSLGTQTQGRWNLPVYYRYPIIADLNVQGAGVRLVRRTGCLIGEAVRCLKRDIARDLQGDPTGRPDPPLARLTPIGASRSVAGLHFVLAGPREPAQARPTAVSRTYRFTIDVRAELYAGPAQKALAPQGWGGVSE